MNSKQWARMEHLQEVEHRTPAENDELKALHALFSDLTQAFYLLQEQNHSPVWVGGEYITVGRAVVRSLAEARRLLAGMHRELSTPAVQLIPALEGAGAAELEAASLLRSRFVNLIRHPALAREVQEASQASLQALHGANVRRFGWQAAEAIRAHAYADAVATTIPVPEAVETEFGALALEPLR